MRRTRLLPGLSILSVAFLGLAVSGGGAQASPKQTRQRESRSRELELHLAAFNARFSNAIEETADRIAAKTRDPRVYRNTLLWKMEAIPFARRLLYENPPLPNYVLTWTMCKRMVFLLEDGAHRKAFGPFQGEAVQTAKDLEKQVRQIGLQLGDEKDVRDLERLIDQHVARWKGSGSYVDVEMSQTFFNWVDQFQRAKGYKESIRSVDEGIDTLNRQLSHYAATLPSAARWQAEFLLADVLLRTGLESSLKNLESVSTEMAAGAERGEGKEQIRSALQTLAGLAAAADRMSALAESPERVIDHFFKRLVQWTLFLFALCALGYGIHAWRDKAAGGRAGRSAGVTGKQEAP